MGDDWKEKKGKKGKKEKRKAKNENAGHAVPLDVIELHTGNLTISLILENHAGKLSHTQTSKNDEKECWLISSNHSTGPVTSLRSKHIKTGTIVL